MIRYKLFLKPEERDLLMIAVRKYKSTAHKYIYSQILLHSDENTPTEKLSASALRERYGISCKTNLSTHKAYNFYKFFPLYLFDSFFFIFLGNVCNCCTFAATPITYIRSLCAAGTPHNLFWGC